MTGEEAKKGKTFGLGCEPVVGSLAPAKKKEYRITNRLEEGKRPIYAVVFNFLDSRYFNVFVTVGGNRITVYQCLEGGVIAVLQSYVDEDKDEAFYTVGWTCSDDGSPYIVAGGSKGIIRIIDAGRESIYRSFIGHGNSINEVRTQTLKPSLVISASKDESLRLWNTQTGICILIFSGAGGHRNEILSVVYTASVHVNYVDCTRWLGDFILSKSVDDEIMLWEPKVKEEITGTGAVDVLQKYPIPECDIWFIKFSCDFHFNIATVGNREGKIYVWELQSCPPVLATKLSHPQSISPIRQTATSFDGSTILSCCEDGTIWRWDDVSNSST
ncbi:Polycomb group protein [Vigna angularis]|uniref:Polycomb group protein n=1 Tax=Phaseolus angularis TaxID=3914 RepID=A0A8T0JGF2_PHAAN|nr:Polycomb group protein [Vigna angularis]